MACPGRPNNLRSGCPSYYEDFFWRKNELKIFIFISFNVSFSKTKYFHTSRNQIQNHWLFFPHKNKTIMQYENNNNDSLAVKMPVQM